MYWFCIMITQNTIKIINSWLYVFRIAKNILNTKYLATLYYSLVYPYIDYGVSLRGLTQYNVHTNLLVNKLKVAKLDDLCKLQTRSQFSLRMKGWTHTQDTRNRLNPDVKRRISITSTSLPATRVQLYWTRFQKKLLLIKQLSHLEII